MIDQDAIKRELNLHGYMVFRISPVQWRARGATGYVDFWPFHKLYKRQYAVGKPEPYTDLLAAVKGQILPWEELDWDREEAILRWKSGIQGIFDLFPQLAWK